MEKLTKLTNSSNQLCNKTSTSFSCFSNERQNIFSVSIGRMKTLNINKVLSFEKKVPAVINAAKSFIPTKELVASLSEEMKKQLENGELILKLRKDGAGFIPTFVDKSGKFKQQIPLVNKNFAPHQMEALSSLAMQQQMEEILELIEEVNHSINDVLQGQQNDRIALYYSAMQQYVEALSIETPYIRQMALLNAVKTANDARFQMLETAKYNIISLQNPKKIKAETQANKVEAIRTALKVINDATGVCASVYCDLGEKDALLCSLQPYQQFIGEYLLSQDSKTLDLLQGWDEKSDNMWYSKPQEIYDKLNEFIEECVTGKIEEREIIYLLPKTAIK